MAGNQLVLPDVININPAVAGFMKGLKGSQIVREFILRYESNISRKRNNNEKM